MKEEKHIKVLFKHDAFEEENVEGAWTKQIGENFMLDNILFYAKEYSWGDIISAEEIDGELYAKDLIEESGHSTVRILLSKESLVKPVRAELEKLGCSSELSNYKKLVSVDIPKIVKYSIIRSYLDSGEQMEKWEYQEACLSSNHQAEFEEEE